MKIPLLGVTKGTMVLALIYLLVRRTERVDTNDWKINLRLALECCLKMRP